MKLTSLKIPSVLLKISFYLYECCACMFLCYMWTALEEARRCGSLWNCCYARLWATIAMLSIKHQYSGKRTSALKWCIISPAPKSCTLREVTKLYNIWNLSLKKRMITKTEARMAVQPCNPSRRWVRYNEKYIVIPAFGRWRQNDQELKVILR